MTTYDETTLEATIERAKREVVEDVLSGRVPYTVSCFGYLHDHVDANYYGGAFETGFDGSDEACAFWNRVQDAVDKWIVSGEMRKTAAMREAEQD